VRNVVANIKSDGAVADGNLTVKGSRVDVLCSFSFTNTNEMRKTKIKPGLKFHKLSDENKAARDERKQQKAEKRAAKVEERAAKKAQKAEEKAARKAAKAEAKAARKAAKEAAKQAAAASEE
jgi:hypothetical protein